MRLTLLTLLLLTSVSLDACWAMLTDQYINGIDKICVYDHRGSTVTTVVRGSDLCRGSIMVDH
jgi:hypothetical protein